jgi:hypothetical protein
VNDYEVPDLPRAYLVEFTDSEGMTQALVTVSEIDLVVLSRPDAQGTSRPIRDDHEGRGWIASVGGGQSPAGSGAVLPGGGRCAPHIELVDDGTHTSEPTSISQEPLAGFLAWPLIHLMDERHDRCGGSVARKALGE